MFLTKANGNVTLHDNGVKKTGFTYDGRMPSPSILAPHMVRSWYEGTYILRNRNLRLLRYVKGYVSHGALVVEEYRDYRY